MDQTQSDNNSNFLQPYDSPSPQSSLHFPIAHVSSSIFEIIHINPLIITIKRNKINSLIFYVGLNIFTNSSSSILTSTSLHLCCNINQFYYIIKIVIRIISNLNCIKLDIILIEILYIVNNNYIVKLEYINLKL